MTATVERKKDQIVSQFNMQVEETAEEEQEEAEETTTTTPTTTTTTPTPTTSKPKGWVRKINIL